MYAYFTLDISVTYLYNCFKQQESKFPKQNTKPDLEKVHAQFTVKAIPMSNKEILK